MRSLCSKADISGSGAYWRLYDRRRDAGGRRLRDVPSASGMRRSTLVELSGMELYEVAHVRRCLAGELVHSVRHAVCAVERRRFPVGARPTRQPLQPEATGAVMEETKWLKPSVSVSAYSHRATSRLYQSRRCSR